MGCIGVKMATEPISFRGDVASGSLLRSFKYGVFDKVTDAVQLWTFVTRTSSDPDSDSHGTETRHMFCQDGNPVWESRSLNFVYHPMETLGPKSVSGKRGTES